MTPGSRTATRTSSAVATIAEAGTDQPRAAASSAVTRTVPAVAALLSSAIGIDSRVDQKLTTGTKGISTADAGGRRGSGRSPVAFRSAAGSARSAPAWSDGEPDGVSVGPGVEPGSVAAGVAVAVGRGVTRPPRVEEPRPAATMSVRMRSAADMPRVTERLMLIPSAPRASGRNWRTRPDSNRRSPA